MQDHGTALIRRRGVGKRLAMSTNDMIIKMSGEDTDGTFTLIEVTLHPGAITPPPHRHAFAELFYVLEGTLAVRIDGQRHNAAAGATVFVSGGTGHAFDVGGETSVRFLVLAMPAGVEEYFLELKEELASLPLGPPDLAVLGSRMAQLSRKYGIEPVATS